MGESDLPCEPAVHGVIATGDVESCKGLWQDFVRDPLVMDWIENGYQLIWSEVAPASKHMPNASSAQEHHDIFFVGFCRDVGGPRRHIVATRREAYGGEPLGGCAKARNGEVPAYGQHALCEPAP